MEKSRLLSFVMLLFCLFLTPPMQAQTGNEKQITMELKGESLSSALKKLEGLSGYKILFSYDDVNKYQVNGQVKGATVEAALKMILKNKPFEYVIDGRFINVNLIKDGSKKPVGGGKKISGVVISKEDGLPVIGASVRVADSNVGAATDIDGRFTLNNVAPGTKLQVSYIGMKTVELVASAEDMEVLLESDSKTLKDVVVTGIFRKARESYTGAATTITQEKLKMYKGQNLLQTLRNADASLNIPMNNAFGSDPNALPQMNIRGTSSLPLSLDELNESTGNNVNTPLIIMDGFEITLTKLMDYNDEEIETITILKDASATAIYGSRGANGVIVIETKQPEPGKLKVTATAGITLEVPDLTSYDLLNARDKLELERMVGLYEYEGLPSETMKYQQDYQKRLRDVISGIDTDWLSKPLRTGVGQNYNIRLEGGRDEFRWGTSLSWRDTNGAMKGSSRSVFNGDITLMYKYKNLLFRNNTNISNTLSDNSPYGSFSTYVSMQPYYRPYDDEGNIIRYFDGLHYNSTKVQNPLYDATLNTFNKNRDLGIINNFSIEWSILPELTMRGQFGISTTRSTSDQFYPAEHSRYNNNTYTGTGVMRKGEYMYGTGNNISYDGRLTLSYSKTFKDKHQLYAGIDYSVSESKYENYNFVAEGFSSQDISSITSALQYQKGGTPTGSQSISRRLGFTGNVNYTYDNRYFVDASYRIDGSSQFGADKRYAPFWSVGLGWNLHHERFMENLTSVINNLRLKASYGVTGTMDFNEAAARTMYYYSAGDRYVNWNAAHLMGLGNRNLTWQDTYETNIGLEFSLFDYRITAAFDYYIKDTKGLVSSMDMPLAMGFSSYSDNIGKVRNSGFETSLSAYIIRDDRREFSWMVSGQLIYNKNEVLTLSDDIKRSNDEYLVANGTSDRTSPARLLYEGRSMYGIYVVRSLGIDPATGQELYLDRNGNVTKVWNKADYTYAGVDATYGSPYRGNASTMLRWKDWTLNISFAYQWGGQTYNKTLIDRVEVTNGVIGSSNVDKRVFEDRWQKPGDKKFFKGYGENATYASSRFVMDDNWFDIQSVSLQYRWDTEWLKRTTKLQSILFSVNMNDLWHFSSIKYERGTDYPFARNIQGSVSFLF